MSHGKIKDAAHTLWGRCVAGERLTGWEIKTQYVLNEPQFNMLKKYLKAKAEEQGVLWGYHPSTNRYVLVNSDGSTEVAREVIYYSLTHGRDGLNASASTMRAGRKAGFVKSKDAKVVSHLASAVDGPLTDLAEHYSSPRPS